MWPFCCCQLKWKKKELLHRYRESFLKNYYYLPGAGADLGAAFFWQHRYWQCNTDFWTAHIQKLKIQDQTWPYFGQKLSFLWLWPTFGQYNGPEQSDQWFGYILGLLIPKSLWFNTNHEIFGQKLLFSGFMANFWPLQWSITVRSLNWLQFWTPHAQKPMIQYQTWQILAKNCHF